jgi:hypothetical protein
MRKRDRILAAVTTTLAFVSILDQLSRRPEDRDWHGHVAGVPYDYRMPTIERLLDRVWNPIDERVLVPQVFGLGWTVNLYQVKRRVQELIA